MKFVCALLVASFCVAYVTAAAAPVEEVNIDPVSAVEAIEGKAQGPGLVDGKNGKVQKRGLFGWGWGGPGFYGGWGPYGGYGWGGFYGGGYGWGGYGWGGYYY